MNMTVSRKDTQVKKVPKQIQMETKSSCIEERKEKAAQSYK